MGTYFTIFILPDKFEQIDCFKFCEILHLAFGENSLGGTDIFLWHEYFKTSQLAKMFRATYPQPKAWKYRIFVDDQSICCLIKIFSRKTWICIILQPSEWILLWCISGVQEALGLMCTLKGDLFLMAAKVKLYMKYLI